MVKSTLTHPHFFHTLVHGFHTHLTIPVDFFSKYIEGKIVEKTTAELKSDSSDMRWKVKMTHRKLTTGWEEFAVANSFQIGEVVLVRYEGDMVFHVSDLGSSCCENRDLPPLRSNNDGHDEIGKNLLKKGLHPRTQVDLSSNDGDGDGGGDDDDYNIEFPRRKKVKKNSPEAEAVPSSSSDDSCFVTLVTASSLRNDKLYLPQHFTSANGLTRNCRKIVLIDGGERSRTLDLKYNKSFDTFYISRGWRNFCEEYSQKAGGFFMFKLVGKGETLVLSFCLRESMNDRRQRDCLGASGRESLSTELSSDEENIEGERSDSSVNLSSEDECSSMESMVETEKNKYTPKGRVWKYSSYSPCHKQSIIFTFPPDHARTGKLTLPKPFLKENGINKPGEIYLLGKDGIKWPINLISDKNGSMSLARGWIDFVKSNGVERGFTLKLIWEDKTPVLSLCCAESTSDREQEEFPKAIEKQSLSTDPSNREKISKVKNNEEGREKTYLRGRDSTPSSQKQFVTLTIKPYCVTQYRLLLPKQFTRENGINKPGMIILLGNNGIKHHTKLLFDKGKGNMYLGNGWRDFAKANGFNMGDSFTLELIWEDSTPVLSLCPAECSVDRGGEEGCFEANQKKSLHREPSSCEKISQVEDIEDGNSKERNNKVESSKYESNKQESRSMEKEKNHLREIDSTPLSKEQFVTLTATPHSRGESKRPRLHLPGQFMRENGINKLGEIYLLGKNNTKWPTKLLRDMKGRMRLGKGLKDFMKANDLKLGEHFTLELIWKDETPMLRLFSTESSTSKAKEKEPIPTEPRSKDSYSAVQNRFVRLVLTLEDVKACKLDLPSQFMRDNGINKLGKMTILGENRMELSGFLLSRDGTVALENGWDEFCEANGVKLGDSFTLEFINEQDKTTPLLKFCSRETNNYKKCN